jgi:hypothetical protein
LGDQRNSGKSSCNSGDGTGQMAQPFDVYDDLVTDIKSTLVCKIGDLAVYSIINYNSDCQKPALSKLFCYQMNRQR